MLCHYLVSPRRGEDGDADGCPFVLLAPHRWSLSAAGLNSPAVTVLGVCPHPLGDCMAAFPPRGSADLLAGQRKAGQEPALSSLPPVPMQWLQETPSSQPR